VTTQIESVLRERHRLSYQANHFSMITRKDLIATCDVITGRVYAFSIQSVGDHDSPPFRPSAGGRVPLGRQGVFIPLHPLKFSLCFNIGLGINSLGENA
jgi:hypothetical protein